MQALRKLTLVRDVTLLVFLSFFIFSRIVDAIYLGFFIVVKFESYSQVNMMLSNVFFYKIELHPFLYNYF